MPSSASSTSSSGSTSRTNSSSVRSRTARTSSMSRSKKKRAPRSMTTAARRPIATPSTKTVGPGPAGRERSGRAWRRRVLTLDRIARRCRARAAPGRVPAPACHGRGPEPARARARRKAGSFARARAEPTGEPGARDREKKWRREGRLLALGVDDLDRAGVDGFLDALVELGVAGQELLVPLLRARGRAGRDLEDLGDQVLAEVAGDAAFHDPDLADRHDGIPSRRRGRTAVARKIPRPSRPGADMLAGPGH